MASKVKIGIIGTGKIGPAYIKGCRHFDILDVVACADIDHERAKTFADEFGLKALTTQELLADPEIEIVVNLTVPRVHAEVSLAIIQAGKHVHSEKPLAVSTEEGQTILKAAAEKGVRVGSAPDTFMGGGHQTCRKLLDDGLIGDPVAAVGFFAAHGPEGWHPNPFFFYEFGGGPLFDLGPYYLTGLVALLGPVKRVTGSARISFEERTAGDHLKNAKIPVSVNTHVSGTLDFESGVIASVITSFDVWRHNLPRIEIYGATGTLSVPDPNHFRGPVQVWRLETGEWEDVELTHSDQVSRGIGVADMAHALQTDRPHRASGELAYHVLELMESFDKASDQGQHIEIKSTLERPAPLPVGLPEGQLD